MCADEKVSLWLTKTKQMYRCNTVQGFILFRLVQTICKILKSSREQKRRKQGPRVTQPKSDYQSRFKSRKGV